MTQFNTENNNHALRLGFWSAMVPGALFVLYVFCFAGILLSSPLFVWTGLNDFLTYEQAHDQTLKYVSYAGMLVFCVAFAVLAQCVRDLAGGTRTIFARVGAAFASLFALASGANYFVQLTCVRLNLAQGATGGLEHLVMANPLGALESVNMLGWTVLLGLACLFMALSLAGREARAARISLFACAANSLTAAVAYALNCTPLLFACMYPLLGGTVIAVSVSSCLLFHKTRKR